MPFSFNDTINIKLLNWEKWPNNKNIEAKPCKHN